MPRQPSAQQSNSTSSSPTSSKQLFAAVWGLPDPYKPQP